MAELRNNGPKRRGRPAKRPSNPQQSQSLSRGLLLLERLAEGEHGISLTDLAQRVGLAPSTTHRLLNTLGQQGFVRHDSALGAWYIGVKAFSVGNAFLHHRDVIDQSRPFMHRLMEQTGETVNLAVLEQHDAVFVAQVECHEMMRMIVRLGSRAPLHASGAGKALFATLSDTEISAILHKRGLAKLTPNTLDTPRKLRTGLQAIKTRGYAVDDEEHAVGLRCVAATIRDEQGTTLAAISLSGPKARITDARIPELGLQVTRAAAAITALIGGCSGSPEFSETSTTAV